MPKKDVQKVIDRQRKTASGSGVFVGGGSGGGSVDLSPYMKIDGTTTMTGNLNMGNFSITNVTLVDGIDIPAHVANVNAHHNQVHSLNGADHTGLLDWAKLNFAGSNITDIVTRLHNSLQGIGPNDHHNQIHAITGSDHTFTGAQTLDLVGATAASTLGVVRPLSTPGAAAAVLRTDSTGAVTIEKITGTQFVKSSAYVEAASYVKAITYVDTPLIQQAGNITISAGISISLNPGSGGYVAIGTDRALRTNSFVSGFTGSGWQIDQNIIGQGTSAEFDNLTIRGRMRVYELIIQQIRATNGSIFVSSVGKAATVSGPVASEYTITTEDVHGFFVNDIIRSQRFTAITPKVIHRCDMRVTAVTDTKTFKAIIENGGDAPAAGMDFVRLGNTNDATRQGSIYLSTDDSAAPFIDVVDGVNGWYNWGQAGYKVKTRIGKITGITSVANEYGLIAGNNGYGQTDSWFKISNKGVVFNNVPLKFFNGANWTGYWDATGTNFWIGTNVNDKKLEWNGTTLNIVGNITITGGNAATQSYAQTQANNAIAYTDANAPKKDLSNTTVNWAGSTTKGGSANDTIAVGGTAATTVRDNAARAALGLDTNGRIVQTIQGVSLPNDAAAVGLNMTRNYIGFYDGAKWSMIMKSEVDPGTGQSIGKFFFGAQTGNRIEWNGVTLAGYTSGVTQPQWYADSRDGKIYAGDGNVVLERRGIILYSGGYSPINPSSSAKEINWFNPTTGLLQGKIGAGANTFNGVVQNALVLSTIGSFANSAAYMQFVGYDGNASYNSNVTFALGRDGQATIYAYSTNVTLLEAMELRFSTTTNPAQIKMNHTASYGFGQGASHVYMEWFHNPGSGIFYSTPPQPSGRAAWMGFGSSGSPYFVIQNDSLSGEIILSSVGANNITNSGRVVAMNKFAIRSNVYGYYSFMEFFPDSSVPTARRAWFGFGTNTNALSLTNEATDAPIHLLTTGGNGVVYINNILRVAQTTDLFGAKIQTSGNIHALGAVTSERFYQLKESTRPVGNLGHWRIYSEGGILYLIDGAGARWRFNITAA